MEPLSKTAANHGNGDKLWHGLGSCQGFDLSTWNPEASPLLGKNGGEVGDCESFHRFGDLPFELRVKIWRIHLERPRIVIIRGLMQDSGVAVEGNHLGNLASNVRWYCQNRSPVLFRVCCESRTEALMFFRIRLPVRNTELDRYGYPEVKHRNPVWDQIYINPDWDMVLYHGTSRSLTMPFLASDLLAWDPAAQGVFHFGSNDWPKSIWTVDPNPGEGMATLEESLANLKSYALCIRPTSDMLESLDEGYIAAVCGQVGGRIISTFETKDSAGNNYPTNSMTRKALAIKGVPQPVVDKLVMTEMTSRVKPSPYGDVVSPVTGGWVLQLTWQPPGRKSSGLMYVATG